MRTLLSIVSAAVLSATVASCGAGAGERCNPQQYSDNGMQGDCDDGYGCVYPTAPQCGVAYCCTVDGKGNVTDDSPNCQPDPTLSCAPDLSPSLIVDMSTVD